MKRTVGVRFKQAGKIFYYEAGDLDLAVSAYVVVDTSHGLDVGRVVIAPDQVLEDQTQEELKPVVRLATAADIERAEELRERAKSDVDDLRRKVSERGLGMSLAGGEYDLDGKQLTAYFTAPERVDFRDLVRDASREIGARIQLLQVGDRDRAKLVDGVDICGERLCCSSWLTAFPSVSIRMAKEQDLPLNPTKISGVCGRLYCCLTFEYEEYKELRGTLPKVGSFISTPAGEARVQGIDFVRETVRLYMTESSTVMDVPCIEMQLQNGVSVRPMELVRKIEGPLRPITEDSRGRGRSRGGSRPTAPTNRAPPVAAPVPAPAPVASAAESGEAPRRRRRRRRRRGGGGGEAPPSDAAGSSA
jgi:cell fate regulator YaaT (PSP1 superfamily)